MLAMAAHFHELIPLAPAHRLAVLLTLQASKPRACSRGRAPRRTLVTSVAAVADESLGSAVRQLQASKELANSVPNAPMAPPVPGAEILSTPPPEALPQPSQGMDFVLDQLREKSPSGEGGALPAALTSGLDGAADALSGATKGITQGASQAASQSSLRHADSAAAAAACCSSSDACCTRAADFCREGVGGAKEGGRGNDWLKWFLHLYDAIPVQGGP
jgi:hypothetical protein